MSRVEICGGIASGKTMLASLLGGLGFYSSFENFRANPFWSMFYEDPKNFSFETEITFLLQHYNQIKVISNSQKIGVLDTSLMLDLAYADVNLSPRYRRSFDAVYDTIVDEVGFPSLLIHLKCPAATELKRIRARGRTEENGITQDYLAKINSAVEAKAHEFAEKFDVLTIDSDGVDFANNEEVREEVGNMIRLKFDAI